MTHFFRANKIKYSELHTFPLDIDMLSYYDIIVVVVRDPLARIVSAYNFQHPAGEDPLPESNRGLYNCFPNLTVFGEHILDRSDCARFARSDFTTHIGLGFCSYIGGRAVRENLLNHRNIVVIRAEHCEMDTNYAAFAVTTATGQTVSMSSIRMPQVHVKKKKTRLMTGLTPLAAENVGNWLRMNGETQLYTDLLETMTKKNQS